MKKKILVDKKSSGSNVDKVIHSKFPDLSRRAIRRALDQGRVLVNGNVERFASRTVHSGNIILFEIINEKPQKTLIDILEPLIVYEDQEILAINKPPFVLSQKTVNKNLTDAKELVLSYLKKKRISPTFKLKLCHRLDKETSGVLVFAKSEKSCDWIMSQFKERKCKKTYEALSFGTPIENPGNKKTF